VTTISGWTIERHATGMVTARGPSGEVAIEETCRRCGTRVVGALDATGRGVYLEASPDAALTFRNGMPFAAAGLKRHAHPEAK
jgi:hypothetical protein